MAKNSAQNKRKKIILISSSGGHFEQLKMLKELEKNYDLVIITEQTKYNRNDKTINYLLPQVNRKELLLPFKMSSIFRKASKIIKKEKPDAIIGTGALITIPMMYLAKKANIKTIHIESFAKIHSPTMTGTFLYKHNLVDRFYVQWKPMLEFYPEAIYKGGIY